MSIPRLSLKGLKIPDLSPEQERVRTIQLNFDEFLRAADPVGDGEPDFLFLKSPDAMKKIDIQVLEFAYCKLKQVNAGEEIREVFASMHDVKDYMPNALIKDDGVDFVVAELMAKLNLLRIEAINYWMDYGENGLLSPLYELEYSFLFPAIAAADKYYIKARYGCIDKSEERKIIAECYENLIDQLKALVNEGKDGEIETENCKAKLQYYEAVISGDKTPPQLPGELQHDHSQIEVSGLEILTIELEIPQEGEFKHGPSISGGTYNKGMDVSLEEVLKEKKIRRRNTRKAKQTLRILDAAMQKTADAAKVATEE